MRVNAVAGRVVGLRASSADTKASAPGVPPGARDIHRSGDGPQNSGGRPGWLVEAGAIAARSPGAIEYNCGRPGSPTSMISAGWPLICVRCCGTSSTGSAGEGRGQPRAGRLSLIPADSVVERAQKNRARAAIDLYDFGFDLFSRPLGVSASQSALSGGWASAFIIFSSTSAGGRCQVLITYPALTRSPLARVNSTTRPSPSASTRVTTG